MAGWDGARSEGDFCADPWWLERCKKTCDKCDGGAGCSIQRDYDLMGDDLYRITDVQSAEICAAECGLESKCKSWTYGKKRNQWYTKICFFKTKVDVEISGAVPSDCCDSGLPCVGRIPDLTSVELGSGSDFKTGYYNYWEYWLTC